MGIFKVNSLGLRAFQERLRGAAGGEIIRRCAETLAKAVAEAAKGRTPVDTGRLQSGFSIEVAECEGGARAVILNPVEYASYVEMGHRTRGGGWVPGRFMLELACDEVMLMAPEMLQSVIADYLKGVFGW